MFNANPPASMEAEKALLGSILINPDVFTETSARLRGRDFYFLRHAHIWDAMCWLASGTFVSDDPEVREQHGFSAAQGTPIDPELLAYALDARNQLEAIGGRSYITELINSTPTSVNASFYAQLIERAAVRRRLIMAADEMKALASDESLDLDSVIAKAEAGVADVSNARPSLIEAARMESEIDRQFADIEAFAEGGGVLVMDDVLPSVFPDAQWTLEGYANGSLVTYGARPGVGKTSLITAEALGIAKYLLKNGDPRRVRIYSLEMTPRQMTDGLVSLETRIPYKPLRKRQLSPAQTNTYVKALDTNSKMPIDIHYRLRTLEDIVADIRRECRDGLLAIAFVDYVQIVGTRKEFRPSDKRMQIGYITKTLKDLAMDLSIPVVMGAQLKRSGGGEPNMEMLKEAGNIEEDSDIVALIHRDMDAAKSLQPGEIQPTTIIIDKNRHGAMGRFQIGFLGECKGFVSISERGYAPPTGGHWTDGNE